jgi:uncharacterized Zn finger protein
MPKQENKIKCPLCGADINLHNAGKNEAISGGQTPMWSCPECPFIGFEFWLPVDVKNLSKHLLKSFKRKPSKPNERKEKLKEDIANFEERTTNLTVLRITNLRITKNRATYNAKVEDFYGVVSFYKDCEVILCTECGEIFFPADQSNNDQRCRNCGNHQSL